MILAANPPRRCHSCQTTWPNCIDAREYRSAACCGSCDHDDHVRTCAGCGASEFGCARQASNGGRTCCSACSHIELRKVER